MPAGGRRGPGTAFSQWSTSQLSPSSQLRTGGFIIFPTFIYNIYSKGLFIFKIFIFRYFHILPGSCRTCRRPSSSRRGSPRCPGRSRCTAASPTQAAGGDILITEKKHIYLVSVGLPRGGLRGGEVPGVLGVDGRPLVVLQHTVPAPWGAGAGERLISLHPKIPRLFPLLELCILKN